MLTFKNTEVKPQATYFTPGKYLCMIRDCKYIESTENDGRPAFIVETTVEEVVRGLDDSNPKGSAPSWVHKPGKFPGGHKKWQEDLLGFWAAVMGLDVSQDLVAIKAAQEDGTVDADMAAATDPKLRKFSGQLVIVDAKEKTTRNGSTITLHSFAPAERGGPVPPF